MYRKKRNASQHIIDLVDGLEETYYIADVLPKPKEFQNEAYYYALKKACKSMNDEIGKITEEKQDYQEYVESFAHEIKIPIRGLVAEGYVIKDEHGYVELTAEGKKIVKKVYARHLLLEEFLERIGVSPETANHDTCRMEHTISEESFRKIQELVKKIKKENASNEQMQLTN